MFLKRNIVKNHFDSLNTYGAYNYLRKYWRPIQEKRQLLTKTLLPWHL